MKLYITKDKQPSLYISKNVAGHNMVVSGRAPSSLGIPERPMVSPNQQGGPRIVLSIGDAMKAATGNGMHDERAADHCTRATKCMQSISKMYKAGEVDSEKVALMHKISGMHSDLAKRFSEAMDKSGDHAYMDGLVAASSYANKAHDMLEESMTEQEKSLSVPGYGQPEKYADPALWLQPQTQPQPNVSVPSNQQKYGA